MFPTLIITNAKIPPGNIRSSWTTALVIEQSKLAALGSSAEIQKLAIPSTKVVDAQGQVIQLPAAAVVGSSVHVTVRPDGTVVVDLVEDVV